MEKCTYRGADSRMILFLSGQVRLRSPELEPAARPKRRHSSRRSGLAAVGGAKTTGRLLIASSRAATERARAVGSARHPVSFVPMTSRRRSLRTCITRTRKAHGSQRQDSRLLYTSGKDPTVFAGQGNSD